MIKKGFVAVDLFCGAGGLTRGLLDAGIKVKKGYDIDLKVKDTYERNNEGVKFYYQDISSLKGEEVIKGLNLKNNFFILAGCAPCQPFSRINKQKLKYDKRKISILEFLRLIKETKPDFILMENVPGLEKGEGKEIFEKFKKNLEKESYFYKTKVVNVKDYGVPQKRRRLILIASNKKEIKFPDPTHGKGKKRYLTVRDTISKYPNLKPGKKDKNVFNHECRNLSELNKKRMKFIKKDGGSRTNLPKEFTLKCHIGHNGHGDVYGRMKWGEVSPTLTCKCTSISNGRFGHPSQDRGISVREAAAIQTFPDKYAFYGSLTDSTKWVGNAVPVKFTKIFGEYFINLVNS